MSYYGWKPYVSVAERRKKAEKAAAKAKKSGANLSPIEPSRGAIAKTFWGKAWCDNLESYGDYTNRLPRGRTYVRNGSVIDLKITEGEVQAQVMGSSLYNVAVKVLAVPAKQWQAIGTDCSGSIDSLVELLQGKLSTAVMKRICTPSIGLFPAPKEISFSCSCPDWAAMCKHVAAVLYGVGARLDQKPELLFSLRRVEAKDLVSQAGADLPKSKKSPAASKVLDSSMLADVFGIEMDETVLVAKEVSPQKKVLPVKKVNKKSTTEMGESAAKASIQSTSTQQSATIKKTTAVKISAKSPASKVAIIKSSARKTKASVAANKKKKVKTPLA